MASSTSGLARRGKRGGAGTGETIGSLVFLLLFFSYYVSPRSLLSPLGVDLGIPAQLLVLGLTTLVALVFALRKKLFLANGLRHTRFFIPLVAGTFGIVFTFVRSLEATGWSRPTLDLASMLLLVPLAYFSGTLATTLRPRMLWGFLSLFALQLLWALITGPNPRGAFTFHSVHSIEFGLMMGTAALVALAIYFSSPSWWLVAAPIIFIAGVIVSNSRGALLATIFGVAILLAFAASKSRRYLRVAALGGGLILGSWLVSVAFYTLHRAPELIASPPLARTGSSGRADLWPSVLDKLPDGLGILWGSGDSYISFWDPTTLTHPHNMLLAFGVTGGIIALLSISVFLLMAFRETVLAAAQDEYSVLFAGLLALWAIHLQFSGNFDDGANIFLLAGFALGRIAASSKARPSRQAIGSRRSAFHRATEK